MSLLMGAAAAGGPAQAVITELGDVTQAVLESVTKVLCTPVVLEFGADGVKVGGRRRSRKTKDGRRLYDDRVMIRRVEVPIVVLLGIAWVAGIWQPGALIGKVLGGMFGPPGTARAPTAEELPLLNIVRNFFSPSWQI